MRSQGVCRSILLAAAARVAMQCAGVKDTIAMQSPSVLTLEKPLLRGWFHAAAAICAVAFTGALCWRGIARGAQVFPLVIFGATMIELYSVSAIYHIGRWAPSARARLRRIDHANIYVLIAGTYTPLCVNVLTGWMRPALLAIIWVLAIAGIGLAATTLSAPRWMGAALYVAMGWVAIFALPAFSQVLPWPALAVLVLGGLLYTVGAVVYARKWPDPYPRIFGFHEIFHLFVVAGGAAFCVAIWLWAVPGAVV